jgi:D-glycero-alpha-D-manno-heptose-7-phosphate kinase
MKSVLVRVPVRADLAGGTLDLWPLYLFHPGARTINVAVSLHAEAQVDRTGEQGIELALTDSGHEMKYDSLTELSRDPKAALVARAVEHFKLSGIRIVTRTEVPRGSGLGGSSAMAIALVRALSELAGTPLDGDPLIALVRDLETRLLGVPAGVQDYYPPVYGGLASLHLNPGAVVRQTLRLPLGELGQHFILHYSEVAHFSGTNNWEIYKRHIDGDNSIRSALRDIARISAEMERALDDQDLPAAGAALAEEWRVRKSVIKGISTPEIDQAITAATAAGAWGGKVCGAGGGGCIVFLAPPEQKERVIRALRKTPGRTLEISPVPYGISIQGAEERQTILSFVERPLRARGAEAIEQLYMSTPTGTSYQPFVLVEGAVTFDDARRGAHVSVTRALLAPVNVREERIEWDKAIRVDPDKLPLTAVPERDREFAIRPNDETLQAVTSEGEESFREFMEETERFTLFHNAQYGLYSEPGETRTEFLQRCLEHGSRGIETETDRLEKTFRRRIDQMKQKLEREDREIEDSDEKPEPSSEVNIAWGQALYNITSGKPIDETSSSPREEDYLQKIATLSKAWKRELESMRESVAGDAEHIEEITVTPERRNIEVRRYIVVWSTGAPTSARKTRSGTGSRSRKKKQRGS